MLSNTPRSIPYETLKSRSATYAAKVEEAKVDAAKTAADAAFSRSETSASKAVVEDAIKNLRDDPNASIDVEAIKDYAKKAKHTRDLSYMAAHAASDEHTWMVELAGIQGYSSKRFKRQFYTSEVLEKADRDKRILAKYKASEKRDIEAFNKFEADQKEAAYANSLLKNFLAAREATTSDE